MPLELVILLAAVVVAWLIFTWLLKVAKVSISTALAIAVIVLMLQLIFGIGPQELWQQVTQLPRVLWQLVSE